MKSNFTRPQAEYILFFIVSLCHCDPCLTLSLSLCLTVLTELLSSLSSLNHCPHCPFNQCVSALTSRWTLSRDQVWVCPPSHYFSISPFLNLTSLLLLDLILKLQSGSSPRCVAPVRSALRSSPTHRQSVRDRLSARTLTAPLSHALWHTHAH